MTIDRPTKDQVLQLRSLWKEAFGDTDDFLDVFFHKAYSPDRSRCITQDGSIVAALYWFNCQCNGQKLAYIYAVATAKHCRGQGLCRKLMEDTHEHLHTLGYDGSILVPQEASLFTMYEKFGYRICSCSHTFSCTAKGEPIALQQASPSEYAAARRLLLPKGGVLQEGITLDFLSTYARLYTGDGIVFAAYPNEGKLEVCELLGDPQAAPKILAELGFSEGTFRVPDHTQPFAMYYPLKPGTVAPRYFGLALN